MNHMKITVSKFYPEKILTKKDADHYQAKGTCEVSLCVNGLEFDIRNITYRIEHSGKMHIKPPFRMHSNKKAGIKPKLVPSIVFKDGEIWHQIESCIKEDLGKANPQLQSFKNVFGTLKSRRSAT
jgi:hypothetical protein